MSGEVREGEERPAARRGPVKRVVVLINGQKFRVPCQEEHTVKWLSQDVARRYERHNKQQEGSVSLAEIRGSDGSLLDFEDSVLDNVDDMEELVGVLNRLSVAPPPHPAPAAAPTAAKALAPFAQPPPSPEALAKASGDVERVRGGGDGERVPPQGAGGWDMEGDEDGMLHTHAVCSPEDEELDSWAKETMRTTSLDGHRDGVTCVYHDGHTAVTGGRDRLVRLWDINTHSILHTLEGHTSNVRCVHAQNGLLVSGGEPTVRVWDAESGRQTSALEGHAHYVSCLALDRELRLVTGSWDRTLRVWIVPKDGSATKSAQTLEGHTASVLCLALNGDRVASGSLTGEVMVWSLLTGANTMSKFADKGSSVNAIQWERNLLFCTADMNIKVMDIITGKVVHTLSGHTDQITCILTHLPYVITGSRDATIRVWSVRTWRCVRVISCPGVRCMAIAHRSLAVGLDTGELQMWRLS